MQIKEIDAKQEMQALAALIYNDAVLAANAKYIERESFQSPFSFDLAKKCEKHYRKYHHAPKNVIQDYIESQIENSPRKDEVNRLQKILDNLSNLKKSSNGKQCNNKYLIDRTKSYLNRTKMGVLLQTAKDAHDNGEYDKAESLFRQVQRVSLNGDIPTSTPSNKIRIREALESGGKPLISFVGPMGQFFGRQLDRGNFVVFMGPEKSFKSFYLQEMCLRGLRESLKVMFIGIGDMSQAQYDRRFYSRLCNRPWRKTEYWYPVGWYPKGEKSVLPKRDKKSTNARITAAEIDTAIGKFCDRHFGTKNFDRFFKTSVVPQISIADIQSLIHRHQDIESWSPDVIVIDYTDRISMPKGVNDKIMGIDHNWNTLREFALEYNSLVISATQSRRSGYKGFPMTREDVSDSKNKTAVVTGLIGINAFEEEYKKDTRRLNWIVCREHTARSVVSVAGCPAIGHPAVTAI